MTNTLAKTGIIKNRFALKSLLGEGGIGITYCAQDLLTKEWVAIKVVSLKQARDWKTIDLLEREASTLRNLDYTKIPKYIDSFTIESKKEKIFYLIQELAPGKTLAQWIEEKHQFSEAQVFKIAQSLLESLKYLQSFSPPIIHRDIKPQNILLDEKGEVYLVDFGAVQDAYRHTVTGGSTVVGTFGYMAPEQFRGAATPATDLYGLGATLIFLLTRQDPSELPEKKLRIDFRAATDIGPFLQKWLDGLIAPTLEERFSNAETALAILNGDRPLYQYQPRTHNRLSIQPSQESLLIQIAPRGFRHRGMKLLLLGLCAYGLVVGIWTATILMAPVAWTQLQNEIVTAFVCLLLGSGVLIAMLYRACDSSWLELSQHEFRMGKGLFAKPSHRIGKFQLPERPLLKGQLTQLRYIQIDSPGTPKAITTINAKRQEYRIGYDLSELEHLEIMEAIASFLETSTVLSRQERERILGIQNFSQT